MHYALVLAGVLAVASLPCSAGLAMVARSSSSVARPSPFSHTLVSRPLHIPFDCDGRRAHLDVSVGTVDTWEAASSFLAEHGYDDSNYNLVEAVERAIRLRAELQRQEG